MGFATALTGIKAAGKDLQVTSNNIANANTSGFKKSRAEFTDIYASSLNSSKGAQIGAGAKVNTIAQNFAQGSVKFTDNAMDMAISGQGFFSLAQNTNAERPIMYTRNGEFKVNDVGYVVTNDGDYLMGFKANGKTVAEGFTEGAFSTIQLAATVGGPSATTSIATSVNLDTRSVQPANYSATTIAADGAATGVDPTDPKTYNHVSSVTIFDSQGNSHVASTYFVTDRTTAGGTANQWQAHFFIDGKSVKPDGTLGTRVNTTTPTATSISGTTAGTDYTVVKFDSKGILTQVGATAGNTLINYTNIPLGGGGGIDPTITVDSLTIKFDLAKTTQLSSEYAVKDLNQDGIPVGNLTGIDIDNKGVVLARFSNGGFDILGKVALTRFSNNQGLQNVGGSLWKESLESGQPVTGQAGTGSFGLINSGALEGSNVDLSQQLVHLIIAQQSYQANAQSISTEKTIMQTILQA